MTGIAVLTSYVIMVCTDCMLIHANGECGERPDGAPEPLCLIDPVDGLALGDDDARVDLSTSACQGCGDDCHGERHEMHVFPGERAPRAAVAPVPADRSAVAGYLAAIDAVPPSGHRQTVELLYRYGPVARGIGDAYDGGYAVGVMPVRAPVDGALAIFRNRADALVFVQARAQMTGGHVIPMADEVEAGCLRCGRTGAAGYAGPCVPRT